MVKKIPNWKPIEIDGNVFAGGVEGLIGIEECTDYELGDIISSKKKLKVPGDGKDSKKKNKDKKKNQDNEIPDKQFVENNTLSPSKEGTTVRDDNNLTTEDIDLDENITNVDSWMNFALPKTILNALQEAKFTQPTQIQSMTLPAAILGRRDILGAAETGSGKTLAFGLPILTGILKIKEKEEKEDETESTPSSDESDLEDLGDNDLGCVKSFKIADKKPQKPLFALVLTPTRELAMQVKSHLNAVAKYTGINVAVVIGGMAAVKQERILSKGPEIVVATPGRLWELIQQGNDHLCQVDNIRFLAIDETDRMLERGHFQELQQLLERINFDETKRKQRQNFVFSATLTLIHELPKHLINKSNLKKSRKISDMSPAQKLQKIVDMLGITDPKIVDLSQGTGTSTTLTECRITCGIEEKDYYIYYFLKKHAGRTLIFCNSIGCVKRLTTLLTLLECNPLPLHASMQQRQRLKNLERFRDVENSILIATDVAARGLDIPSVEHVLHYQTPRTSESYVHRSGRTARASNQGITVLIMEPNEFRNYLRLCKTLEKGEDLPIFPVQENYLNAVKQRVKLARELDKLQLQVKKANSEAGWFQKAAEDMDIIVDDIAKKYDTKEAQVSKKEADIKRKQLASLLEKPIFPKGFSGNYPLMNTLEIPTPLIEGERKEEKAIDVMKNALETYAKQKKKFIPLYKPKNNKPDKKHGVIKLNKFKKDKNITRQKKKFRGKGRK